MKKYLFGLAFIGSVLSTSYETKAQGSFDGACCMAIRETCYHPIGMIFADSIWDATVTTGC